MKVNLGCGTSYLEGWVNVDSSPEVRADVYADAFEFVRDHGPEIDEVYMGHLLEHMLPASAVALLSLIRERLPAGAVVSAVVPDIRAVFAAYDAGELTNAELNERFVYSYEQPSHHVWCYDAASLAEVFGEAGFTDVAEIDPLRWEPVHWKSGPESRWQCGVRAIVTEEAAKVASRRRVYREAAAETRDRPVTTDEILLERIRRLREQVAAEPLTPRRAIETVASTPAPRAGAPGSRGALRAALERSLPEGSRRRNLLRFSRLVARDARSFTEHVSEHWRTWGAPAGGTPSYRRWCSWHDATRWELKAQRDIALDLPHPPGVHFVIRATDVERARATLASLERQSWPHWSATVIGPDPLRAAVAETSGRVRFVADDGSQEATITNRVAREVPERDFLVLARGGDRFAPDCCFHVGMTTWRDPLVDLVTWDDDLLDERGRRHDPRFRPSWSPDALLGANYLGRAFAIRARRLLAADGVRGALGHAAEWDLLLRADLDAHRVARVTRVLAHLEERRDPQPAEALLVVGDHLRRCGEDAEVRFEEGTVRVQWRRPLPHVSIVIPTRHNRPMLRRCLDSLARTDYPSFDVIVVDNGGRSDGREAWYRTTFERLDLRVEWWERPFNYSAVNNHAARSARGEVLVFLNDDTETPDPGWLRELVGWAVRPGVGVAGLQLTGADGTIQHGGVILGLNGFADHLFQGMAPGSDSLLGSTRWYRNVLAVTAACLAIRRDLFEQLEGFDERFVLCGSDVVLGLDATLAGKRNVCSPFGGVRHLESSTRGAHVPPEDFFASYWRYQRWIFAGDPYYSPSLSLESRVPRLRSRHERSPRERLTAPLGRTVSVFRQQGDAVEAAMLADTFRVTDSDARSVRASHELNRRPFAPATVNWFLPDIDSPFYGGYNTALRIADHLARMHGVENRFVVWATPNEAFFRSAVAAAFPGLADSPVVFHDATRKALERLPECDVAVATLWATAHSVAQFPGARRRAYLIQDFEPMFYPAGSLYALAEETYRLGLYGLCNTEHMLDVYRARYGGVGTFFTPAIDPAIFHADGRVDQRALDVPATVFVYARPGHWRNCWEMASIALEELKRGLGDRVRIVTAGSWARPEDVGSGIEHLGLLDYRETADLYRRCDVGMALTVSEHPSYLPLELMACGVPVVAFANPAGSWLLRDRENCLLARRSVDALRDALARIVLDPELGRALARRGLRDIAESHSSWDKALSGIYGYLSDPEGVGGMPWLGDAAPATSEVR